MKRSIPIKLDENLGNRGAEMFRADGYDVATVYEEGLATASDNKVGEACHAEKRCLVTLDRDFANPFLYDPSEYSGIAVLRLPAKITEDLLDEAFSCLDCRPCHVGHPRSIVDSPRAADTRILSFE